jgi:hypothetical protein
MYNNNKQYNIKEMNTESTNIYNNNNNKQYIGQGKVKNMNTKNTTLNQTKQITGKPYGI